jgi:two-component system sensor histidine kinase CiaH
MFHKATVKLTALYLGIIMLISLAFSLSLYQISVRELDRGLRGQSQAIFNGPRFDMFFDDPRQIDINREDELAKSRRNLAIDLVLINVAILIGGGILSYYLARRTLRPIEEVHHAQSRFTADASHELRTPLAVMQTEIEVALMDPKLSLADAKQQLNSNLEELTKLTSLTEGLLQLSRFDNNGLVKTKIDLKSLVKDTAERAKPRSAQKNITIKTKLTDDIYVSADKTSLEEALLTILDNAIKYSPNKSSIYVEITKKASHAFISIKDEGVGISEDNLEHIFERFYQADSSRNKLATDGFGLGLAIAKSIVDGHGGEITATSQLKKGSTFTIKLPLVSK